jgi:hypothetical protein
MREDQRRLPLARPALTTQVDAIQRGEAQGLGDGGGGFGNHTAEYVGAKRPRQYAAVRSRNAQKVKVLRNTYGSGWIANR